MGDAWLRGLASHDKWNKVSVLNTCTPSNNAVSTVGGRDIFSTTRWLSNHGGDGDGSSRRGHVRKEVGELGLRYGRIPLALILVEAFYWFLTIPSDTLAPIQVTGSVDLERTHES